MEHYSKITYVYGSVIIDWIGDIKDIGLIRELMLRLDIKYDLNFSLFFYVLKGWFGLFTMVWGIGICLIF